MNKLSIFSFLTTLFLVCTQGQTIVPLEVKDTAGNPVEIGQRYFIQPVKTSSNNGNGLVPAPISIPLCPLGISQISRPDLRGIPVRFIHFNNRSQDNIVRTTNGYMIDYSDIGTVCDNYSKLWAAQSSDFSKEPPIIVGGINGAYSARFFVDEAEGANTYKLRTISYIHNVVNTGHVGTKRGGLFDAPQLIVTEDNAKSLIFKFKKDDDGTTSTSLEKPGLRMFPF